MKETMRVMKNRNTLFCHCLNNLAVSVCVYMCCLLWVQDAAARSCIFRKRCRAAAGPGSGSRRQCCGSQWLFGSDGRCRLWADGGRWYVTGVKHCVFLKMNISPSPFITSLPLTQWMNCWTTEFYLRLKNTMFRLKKYFTTSTTSHFLPEMRTSRLHVMCSEPGAFTN